MQAIVFRLADFGYGGFHLADVFLSYKSEDRARVQPLVEALQADGLSVWWDAQIEGGSGWRQAIQTELDSAKCVLVAWTKRSVGPQGQFVHDEATRAQRRGAYLPVLVDAVEPPLGFGEVQALPLAGWKGDRADPRYLNVLAAVRSVVAGVPRGPAMAPTASVGRRQFVQGGLALGAVAVAGGGWWLWRGQGGAETDSIAVLPFANLSGDPAQAYFADGIAEELRASLSRIAELKVAARTSSEMFRDSADVKKAARELGVANVLVGSVRRSADTVRVSAQLVDGENGLEKWSESYDRPAGNELAIQSGIAESVAGALRIRFGGAERAALQVGGTNVPAAQDAMLRGRQIDVNADDERREALAYFDAAIAADPDFASAHAERAFALSGLAGANQVNAERAEMMKSARASAERAVKLAPKLPMAYVALGDLHTNELNMAGAYRAYREALQLPGIDSSTLSNIAVFLAEMGRVDEALALNERAIALDPLNWSARRRKATILFYAGRPGDAVAAGRQLRPGQPADSVPYWTIGNSLILLDRPREALAEFAKVEVEWARLLGEAIATARLGDRKAADRAFAEFRKMDDGLLDYQFAQIHAQRGETELALAALEQAWVKRDPGLSTLKVDPMLNPLRGDPRFKALVKKMNFP